MAASLLLAGLGCGGPHAATTRPLWAGAATAVPPEAQEAVQALVPPLAGADVIGATATPYDWTGYSVTAADVNGDGHPDLLASALAARKGGRVMVFYGPITGTETPASADVSFTGEAAYSNLGESMAHAGGCDVNGDGFDDVVLGAPFADAVDIAPNPNISGDNRGKAYIFFGSAKLQGPIAATSAAVTFVGERDYDGAGSSTACLGDLDGDGFDDLAIAARRHSGAAGRRAGAVYVIYGRAAFTEPTVGLASADAVLTGEAAFDNAGVAVAGVGDVNGDRRPDLLVSAPMSDAGGPESGAVYLVPGGRARLAGVISLAGVPRLYVARPGVRLGWSLDRVGDFDGDGVNDFILGSAPIDDVVGGAWLVRGGSYLRGDVDVDLATHATRLDGEAAGDGAGIGVAGVGDLNGDGLADVMVGAVFGQGEVASAGRAYLVLGRAHPPLALPLAQAAWQSGGPAADAYYGENLTALGDIDGDGRADFAVSARGTSQDGTIHVGAVHIFRGQGRLKE